MKKVQCLEVTQPLGSYYVSKLTIADIENLFQINRRNGNFGIQRKLDEKRKKEITAYCDDPDAIFPTPIIFSIKSDDVDYFKKDGSIFSFVIKDNVKLSVVDGQHRIYGIIDSNFSKDYELPVVFMFDITEEEEAYIFSTINFNQKKVDKSLIYDLFDVYSTRSPKKTCHEIAKALNENINSPFYKKLKILGKKESPNESLSQGTFVYHLLPLICPVKEADEIARQIKLKKKPPEYKECIFNSYFMKEEDSTIYQILFNYFTAARRVFLTEWENHDYILTKSTGYGGLMFALDEIFWLCQQNKSASISFFKQIFEKTKQTLLERNLELTSSCFGSGRTQQKNLANIIIECAKELYL